MKLLSSCLFLIMLGVYAEEAQPVVIAQTPLSSSEQKSLDDWKEIVSRLSSHCATYLASCDQELIASETKKITDRLKDSDETAARTALYDWMCDNRGKVKSMDQPTIQKVLIWFRFFSERNWTPPHSVRSRVTMELVEEMCTKLQEWMSSGVVTKE